MGYIQESVARHATIYQRTHFDWGKSLIVHAVILVLMAAGIRMEVLVPRGVPIVRCDGEVRWARPRGVPVEKRDVGEMVKEAIAEGSAFSLLAAGRRLENLRLLKRAARLGSIRAYTRWLLLRIQKCVSGENLPQMFAGIEDGSRRGDVDCAMYLAKFYTWSSAIDKATAWLRVAAVAGEGDGMNAYACLMIWNGDRDEATRVWRVLDTVYGAACGVLQMAALEFGDRHFHYHLLSNRKLRWRFADFLAGRGRPYEAFSVYRTLGQEGDAGRRCKSLIARASVAGDPGARYLMGVGEYEMSGWTPEARRLVLDAARAGAMGAFRVAGDRVGQHVTWLRAAVAGGQLGSCGNLVVLLDTSPDRERFKSEIQTLIRLGERCAIPRDLFEYGAAIKDLGAFRRRGIHAIRRAALGGSDWVDVVVMELERDGELTLARSHFPLKGMEQNLSDWPEMACDRSSVAFLDG
jgi:hypothetical protein